MQTSSIGTEPRERDEAVAAAGGVFAKIFVPIDYTMDCHRALGVALELQRTHGSEIRLFHAARGDASEDWHGGIGADFVQGDWVTRARARLRDFVENVAPEALDKVELHACMGGETLRLVREEARRWGATLLVAAAPVHARLVRSSAEKLVHDIDIPALIIPSTG